MPGGQHEAQLRRGAHHQQLQLPQRLFRAQLVHVVDHQPQPVLQRRQVRQQPLDDRPPVQVRRRRQLPAPAPTPPPSGAARPAPTARTAADHARPRPTGTHAARSARPASADPGPQQHRLAAARRRRHHRHPRLRRQPPEQPRTGHDTSRTRTSGAAGSGLRAPGRPHSPSSHDRQLARPVAVSLSSPAIPNASARRRRVRAMAHQCGRSGAGPVPPGASHLMKYQNSGVA